MNGQPTHQQLTDRQDQILRMVVRGHTNTEIANELGISLNGVKWHIRELFAKFGVDTREELSDAWQESRRPLNRAHRWVRGLGFGIPLKLTVGGTAAAVTLGVAAGAVLAFANMDRNATVEAGKKGDLAVHASPAPTPTIEMPRVFLAPAGSVVTLDGSSTAVYLAAIEQLPPLLLQAGLGPAIHSDGYTTRDLEFVEMKWHPGTNGEFELADSDHYLPAPDTGQPRDLWEIRWRIGDALLLGTTQPAEFELTVIVDQADGRIAGWHYEHGDRSGSTMNSRSRDELAVRAEARMNVYERIGELVFLAYRDNLEGSRWMSAYATLSGVPCLAYVEGGEQRNSMCPFLPYEPLAFFGGLSVSDRHGNILDKSTLVATAPEITSIQVVSDSFEPRTYETQPIPDELALEGRVAYITLLPSPSSYVVIGYNEAGEEVARKSSWP